MKAISESQLWKKHLGDWVLNPYIGCEHGCFHCYCPAMPGVKFFNGKRPQSDWGKYLIPKPGFVDAVKQTLKTFTPDKAKRTEWGNGWVLMSFLTDCYTPAEAKHKITRQCLQLLLEAGHKVRVQTRSALVERDFDILRAHRDQVILGTSLPYMDDKRARVLEPRATGPTRRLKMLINAAQDGIPIYAAVAPVMPFSFEMVEFASTLAALHHLPVREVFSEVLNPKGENLAGMITALKKGNYWVDARTLENYDVKEWSRHTFEVLRTGYRAFGLNFIPWPDTQRGWAKHLSADKVAWLDQFLPLKEAA